MHESETLAMTAKPVDDISFLQAHANALGEEIGDFRPLDPHAFAETLVLSKHLELHMFRDFSCKARAPPQLPSSLRHS